MVLPEAASDLRGGPRGLRRRRRLHRGDRLDRLAADRHRDALQLRRQLQGVLVARRRAAIGATTSRRPAAGFASADGQARRRLRAAGHPRRRRSARSWPSASGCGPDVAVAVGNVDSFVSVPGAGVERAGNARDRRRHLDLRHGRAPRARSCCPGSPASCATASSRACTATRPGSRPSATCSAGTSASCSAPTQRARRSATTRSSETPARCAPARPDWSRSTGGTATARSSPTPTCPA